MKGKLKWVFGCLGCAGLAGGGCLIAFLGLMVFGASQPLGPDLWYELPNHRFRLSTAPCTTEWREEGEQLICDELARVPSVATNLATKVTVTQDGMRVRSVHLEIPDYWPRVEEDSDGRARLLDWSETIADDIDLSNCEAEFVPYTDGGLQRCEGLVYAYLMGLGDSGLPTRPHLWIGMTYEDIKDSFHEEGKKELRNTAELHLGEAKEPTFLTTPASAEQGLVNAYFYYAQLWNETKDEEIKAKLEEIRELRETIRAEAKEQRVAAGAPGPLPKRVGFVQFGNLFAVDKDVLEGFLGEPSRCKGKECVYRNEFWDLKVTYDGSTPQRLILEIAAESIQIPLGESSLVFFDLLAQPATSITTDEVIWSDIGGLSRLEFQSDEGGIITRVIAYR